MHEKIGGNATPTSSLELAQAGRTDHFGVLLGGHSVRLNAVDGDVGCGATLEALPFIALPDQVLQILRDHGLPGIGHLIQPFRHDI